ncbi:Increased DNA methylation like [Heracleum sosnowskyi]|uniref:Increased DNA methylation like n=1 Tax=Heracleum sosnowskyi TaxID=360622 RepID=A0AAD8MZH9_9APIA|nr:Increased DNA methylation like [Heracleum sosnowskyi]
MEEGMGSGERGSDVIKKKSSSGCLIIKKKVNGVSGFGGSSLNKGFESRSEKKRSRLVLTDSGSSEEMVEPERRRVREDIIYERRRSGIEDSRMLGFERKRGGIDVFEFDECDGFDGKRMRMDYMDDRLKLVGRSGDYDGFEIGSSRNVVFDGRKGSVSGGRSRGTNYSGQSRYEEEDEDDDDDDESHLPSSIFREKRREAPIESIRVQGKNGVLKVMVNKNKQQGFPVKGFNYPRADERMSSRSEAAFKKNKVMRPSFYSDSKRPEKPVSFKTDKKYVNSRKALPILSSKTEDKDEDSDSNDSENSLQQETSEQAQRSKKAIDNEHKKTTQTEILTPPTGGKENKVKRGNGTEKQLLREKIRSMLLDRGWKIDYRPRRNRDYLDAVYINPAGTAYWSIIKAYDALQKQLEEEEDNVKPCDESTSFTPLPEEIISKLTRQTRKKIERELKKKKRDAVCSRNSKEITRRESANCIDSEQQEEKLSHNRKHNHKSLRGRLHEADHVSGNDSGDNLYQVKAKEDMPERQSATNSHIIQGRKSRKIGRCTLLVRSSDKGLNSEADGYVPYTGKRTILSWLVDSGIVQTGEKVQYMNGRKTRVMLEGWVTKDGIHCGCCSKILTISKFEIHAGSKQRQPFLNIYLESGISLMQCQIDAWNKQKESEREAFHSVDVDGDPNDDTCGLCGDGGDLICCDGCPSTFHQSCLNMKMLPTGDWHCPNCTCKFCGFAGRSNAKADDRTDSSLLLCSLCEKKYHPSCSQDEVNISLNSGDTANSFCGKNCEEIFSHLQKLLGVKHELESGFSWSLVRRMDPAFERLHLGFPQRVECNSKLAVALSVMDECFLPIVDRRSGINLIHNVLYNCGSNFTRLSYSAFYTAILEKGDEIISAASIRIHGMQLAEMPFIGTRHIYRRQGMCCRLLSAIELALGTLKVEKLIIPAIAEHMNTWTEKFNFSPLEKSHKQEMWSMNMLVFPGTDMLQKLLIKRKIIEGSIKQETAEGSIGNNPGLQSTKANEDSPMLPVFGVSETDSSPKHDFNTSEGSDLLPLTESSRKATALLSSSQILTVPLNDIPAISGSLIFSCELKHEPAIETTPAIKLTSVNNLAESLGFKSTSPLNEHSSTYVAQKAEQGQSVKDHTQSSVDGVITLEEKAKAASDELVGDSSCETSNGKIDDDDATVIQNSVSVHDSGSHGTSESTHVESDTSNHTAVDSDNAREVYMNDTSANPPIDSIEELCAKHNVDDDTLRENSTVNIEEDATVIQNSTVNIEEDATAIQNSIHVHDCVSRVTSESRHIDTNTSDHTAVDMIDTCEVHVNDASVNPHKDAAEHLIAKDIAEDETSCKTFANTIEEDTTATQNSGYVNDSVGNIVEDQAAVQNSVSVHIDFDTSEHTAVDLDSTCEVDLNDTFVDSPKNSVEQSSTENTVKEDVTAIGIITQNNGGNVVDGVHEEHKAANVEPVIDPFNKTLLMSNTSQTVGEDPSELSPATDVVDDKRKGGLENSILGDAQKVDVKVASIELIVNTVCGTSVAKNTCQALNENGTGSTSGERTKDVNSDSFPSDDMKSDSHVMATEDHSIS